MRAPLVLVLVLAAGCAAPRGEPAAPARAPAAPAAPPRDRPFDPSTAPRTGFAQDGPSAPTRAAALERPAVAAIAQEWLPIDLPSALRLAGERSNRIDAARARLEEAEGARAVATGRLLPTLAAGGAFSRHEGRIQGTDGAFVEVDRQRVFLGGVAEVAIDVGGGVYDLLAARQRVRAREFALSRTGNDVALEAAERYFDLVFFQASVRIAEEAVEHARAFLKVAERREALGLGLRVDTLRARARLRGTEADLVVAGETFRAASARLATVLRIDPTATLYSAEPVLRQVTLVDPGTPAAALIREALVRRPEVGEAASLLEAAGAEHDGAAYGPIFPTLRAGVAGLGGGYGVEGPRLGDLRDREDYYVGIEWRIDGLGFGTYGRSAAAEAREREARALARDVEDRIRVEIVETREAAVARAAAIELADAELAAGEEALAISQRRLDQGTGLAIEVLDAQATRTRAATRFAGAIAEYNKAQYRLFQRLGERPVARAEVR